MNHHPSCEPDNEDCASYDCPCACHPDGEMERWVDAVLDAWMAAGCPLADGTHAHPGADIDECEAKRDAERVEMLREYGL